jgi:hypothetical protein
MLKGQSKNVFRKPRNLLENRHNDSLKESQFTLSQGIMKKKAVVDDADADDEMRASASQNHVTATL